MNLSLCQEQRLRASTIKVMLRHRAGTSRSLLTLSGPVPAKVCRLCTPYQRHWAPQHLQPAVTTLPNSSLAASRPTDRGKHWQARPRLVCTSPGTSQPHPNYSVTLQPQALSCSIFRLFSHCADAILDGIHDTVSPLLPLTRNLVEPCKKTRSALTSNMIHSLATLPYLTTYTIQYTLPACPFCMALAAEDAGVQRSRHSKPHS